MFAHDTKSDKDYVLSGEAAMAVDDPVCVCGFEKALSAGQLINFGDPVCSVMDCIEQLSTRKLVHSRMVSIFFVTKFLATLVTCL